SGTRTSPAAPTLAMRRPLISTVAFALGGRLSTLITVAPTSAMASLALGTADGAQAPTIAPAHGHAAQ
ncbi:MAG: hypothetical protein ACRENH_12540, partial [Gemmatimonadaceae bacterium]